MSFGRLYINVGTQTWEIKALFKLLTGYLAYMAIGIKEYEAAKLEEQSIIIPGTNQYIIELDVHHQLHCLDALRMALFPSTGHGKLGSEHHHRRAAHYDGWHLGDCVLARHRSYRFRTNCIRPLH
jgi:hypothetical protein